MLLETDKCVIGRKIKEYRKRKRLTQSQLAEKVDLNTKQISRIESGQNLPAYLTFVKLIDILDINIKDLITNSSQQENPLNDEILRILKNADEYELKLYRDVLYSLMKNLRVKKRQKTD